MLTRALAQAVFTEAVAACDPTVLVAAALSDLASLDGRRLAIAAGKAALAMARGAGPVARGIAIAPADDGEPLPAGWVRMLAAHPVPDERSVAAGDAALALAESAGPDDQLLVLISGGASSLMESPRISLAEYRGITSAVMASGAPIHEINVVRSALSRVKGGGLVARCAARVVTLAISDVLDDDLTVIGSGPSIAPVSPIAERAIAVLQRHGLAVPAVLESEQTSPPRIGDVSRVIAGIAAFSTAAVSALAKRSLWASRSAAPLAGDVESCAAQLAAEPGVVVAWGEPTLAVPADHGDGGRAQHLALLLARALRGGDRAALVIGSDGIDGPAPAGRPTPAGAFVDGTTWDAIAAAGLDPERVLARRDAGTALAAVRALVVTGPTGINHADLVLLG